MSVDRPEKPEADSSSGSDLDDWWIEPGERVLWLGTPKVTGDYRRRLLLRLGFLLVLAVVVVQLPFGGPLDERLIVAGITVLLILGFGIMFIPSYLARLRQTRYVVTSRRGVVIVGRSPTDGSALWAPISSKKIRMRRERNGVADLSWGKPEGRLGRAEPGWRNLLDALGLFSKDDRDELLFVRIVHPDRTLGAIRGARSAQGLSSDF